MLKQKGQDVKTTDLTESGRKNSQNFVDTDEVAEMTAVKDKQIDVLSSMFAEK